MLKVPLSLNTDLATLNNHVQYFKSPNIDASIRFDADTQTLHINNIWYDRCSTVRVSGIMSETGKSGYFDFEIRTTHYNWHVVYKYSSDFLTDITPKMSTPYGGYMSVQLSSSYGTYTKDAKWSSIYIAYFKDPA